MRATHPNHVATLVALAAMLAAGCSDSSGPGTPEPEGTGAVATPLGTVEVTTTTTGVDLDTDGYYLVLEGQGIQGTGIRLPADGTVTLSEIRLGTYLLNLQVIRSNCYVALPSFTKVTVVSATPARLTLDIRCEAVRQLAFVRGEASSAEIYVTNSDGNGETRLTANVVPDLEPSWSSDGRKIAYTSRNELNFDIHVMDSDGKNPLRLTTGTSVDNRPAWSPDGRRIAFVSDRDGNPEIYVMNADGTNPVRLTNEIEPDSDPAWSPDGTRIAFRSERGGSSGIWVMNADGSGAFRITSNTVVNADASPAWSPDGTRIAFLSWSAPQGFELAVVNANGSARTRVRGVHMGTKPSWSTNGRTIAVTVNDFYYGLYVTVFSPDGIATLSYITPGYQAAWRPVSGDPCLGCWDSKVVTEGYQTARRNAP